MGESETVLRADSLWRHVMVYLSHARGEVESLNFDAALVLTNEASTLLRELKQLDGPTHRKAEAIRTRIRASVTEE